MKARENISILLVDDRADKLLALEAVLSDLPLHIVRAHSGREALRALLQQEFAVILLDVNMPGMDGFETAELIRQRKSTEHTPIIFVTAYQDEVFMSRGYSLGAVDYILQPVVPDILRSKVLVFVDLFRKNQLVSEQVEWQQHRASQLQRLAQASVAINAAPSMQQTLQTITDTARDIIGAHQAITLFFCSTDGEANARSQTFCSFSEKYAIWRGRPLLLDALANSLVARSSAPTRLTSRQFRVHPDWPVVNPMIDAREIPPVLGMLAAPLIGRDGRNIGVIYLSDRNSEEFTEEDQAILVQLSQMGAVAVENILSAEAREANRAKDQFIAVLSHELRTPLTPVLATLAGLETDKRLPADVAEDIAMIRRNVELEARLIDDLLDLTRISKGKVEIHLTPVDAHAALRETLQICRPEIEQKELQVTVELRAREHCVMADPTRLQQIFWNLVKNAVKFTPPRGKVNVQTSVTAGGDLRFSVTDTGIGITPEVMPRIFTAFEQGRTAITRQFGGLGLGLAITKALVERHGGSIEALSAGAGKGATFAISLPLTKEAPRPLPVQRARASNLHGQGRRVLLAEDHADTSRVMSRLLTGAGYRVDCANSVAAAVRCAELEKYDILISDIGLPDGSGLDLMRKLGDRRPGIGIAMSGFGMEQDIARSKEAGFSEHLTKPVNLQLLLDLIEQLEAIDEGTKPVAVPHGSVDHAG